MYVYCIYIYKVVLINNKMSSLHHWIATENHYRFGNTGLTDLMKLYLIKL